LKIIDWQMAHVAFALEQVLQPAKARRELQPTRSSRGLIGPVVNLVRRLIWRAAGMHDLVSRQELLQIVSEIETTLAQASQRQPGLRFHLRENTNDWAIFRETNLENHYRLPDRLGPDDVVIDIGMHNGSFAFAALARGAGRLYGFDVDEANFALAAKNLEPFGDRARICRRAVWRSDRRGDILCMPQCVPDNPGGGTLLCTSGEPKLETVALDDVLDEATEGGRKRVTMLKIDCEGSEYPILMTAKKLHLVDRIHGEYHEVNNGGTTIDVVPPSAQVAGINRYTFDSIAHCLREADFDLESQRHSDHLGLFFATRRQAYRAAA